MGGDWGTTKHMILGALTVPFSKQPLHKVLPYLRSIGIQAVELGTGGFTNKAHCDPAIYLHNRDKISELKTLLNDNGMIISALSCHGNPVHPNRIIAERDHRNFVDTCKLANKLGIDRVVTFSGCPGDCESAQHPNWVTCPWPEEFSDILIYQWENVLIPYWEKAAKIAEDNGVKVAIEMHPGFCVYNPETMLCLHNAVGKSIGANFDPSHLFWQSIDAVSAIRELGPVIYYVHAKDSTVDIENIRKKGVIDTKHYSRIQERAWTFRTVGYGHGEKVWKDIISNLRIVGYDSVMSIEHEDALFSAKEGFEKAVTFLKSILITERPDEMWWA